MPNVVSQEHIGSIFRVDAMHDSYMKQASGKVLIDLLVDPEDRLIQDKKN
jgi:hypothetical protein